MRNFVLFCNFLLYVYVKSSDPDEKSLNLWNEYKADFNIKFKTNSEDEDGFQIFKKTLKKIERHNERFNAGLETYRMGVNRFAHLTYEEFSRTMLGLKIEEIPTNTTNMLSLHSVTDVPHEMDWRLKGAVTNIKDQGVCGSCWAFSTAGAIEAYNILETGQPITLSEQQLVDCDRESRGCQEGNPISALIYVKNTGGIMSDGDYPYQGIDGQCRFDQSKVAVVVDDVMVVPKGEENLKKAVGSIGPVMMYLHATQQMSTYIGGIYEEGNCNYPCNHALLAVGYGTENGRDYWIIKNSWGTGFGEQGYLRLVRNKNMCSIGELDNLIPMIRK